MMTGSSTAASRSRSLIAEDPDVADYAASLLRIEYETDAHTTDLARARHAAYEPPKRRFGLKALPRPRGDPQGAFDKAAIRVANEYRTAIEHHNPIGASRLDRHLRGRRQAHDPRQDTRSPEQPEICCEDLRTLRAMTSVSSRPSSAAPSGRASAPNTSSSSP